MVADEVRKLSEGAKKSTLAISRDIKEVYSNVGALIESIGQMAVVSENQAIDVVSLAQSLGEIARLAETLVSSGDV